MLRHLKNPASHLPQINHQKLAPKEAEEAEPPKEAEPRTEGTQGKQEWSVGEPSEAPAQEKTTQATREPQLKRPVSSSIASGAPLDREEETVPMTMLRRTIARRLVEATQTMAMLTTFNEADLSDIQELRDRFGELFQRRYETKLGLMSFFVNAAIDALKQIPNLNAEVRGTDIVFRNFFDIGVAIATEQGLVVPVIRNADQLSFSEMEKTIGDFAKRAREGRLKPEELEGGTFTITNGGIFGSLLSTPIINPPQSGILGMHTIQNRPVALNGSVVIRPMMYLALTYDHRIVDGREAIFFLQRVKESIENPSRMLIEI